MQEGTGILIQLFRAGQSAEISISIWVEFLVASSP
jgi:hypothetical protein